MDKKDLKALEAELLMTLSSAEEKEFAAQFAYFKSQSDLLGEIEGIDEVEPLIFPYVEEKTYLRPDEVEETPKREEILKNSRNVSGDFVTVAKVVK